MLRQDGCIDSMTSTMNLFFRSIAHCLIWMALCSQPMLAMASVANPQATSSNSSTAAATPDTQQVATEIRAGVRDDSRIASAVAALLLRQATLSGVSVEVHSGIVTLGGKVPQEVDRARAETLARKVSGVSDVVNAIELDASLHTRFAAAVQQVDGKFVRLLAAIPLLVAAIAIVLLSMWLGHYLSGRTQWLALRSGNPYMDGLLRRIVRTVVVLVGVLIALDLLGATSLLGAVIGSAGVVGLVLGFGFKDIAENYIAGILLSLRRPFAPGDHLVIDKYEGRVVSLTSRATLLMTLDGNRLSLPNALVFKSVVLNYSVNPKRRFDFSIPIDTGASIRKAQTLAMDEIARVNGVLTDPAPSWAVDGYADSGIVVRFYGWVDQRDSDLRKVRSEALRMVKASFAENSIETPRSVQYIVTMPTFPDKVAASQISAPPIEAAEPPGGEDTSVNRDIDAQLAAAQQSTQEHNLLDSTNREVTDPES
jgi:small conductance mechanosensitive channel